MSRIQSVSSTVGGYVSNLYERASQMVRPSDERTGEQQPLLHGQSSPEYGSTPRDTIPVPKPNKVKSPVKVEAKVWFANEVRPHIAQPPLTDSAPGFRGCAALCLWARYRSHSSIPLRTLGRSLCHRHLSLALSSLIRCACSGPSARLVLSTR